MFDNIGGKIKTWAQILCILGITGAVIGAIATLMQSNYYHVTILESVLILGLGSLGSWVGSFITYGFGELIENTTKIHEDNIELQKMLTLIGRDSDKAETQENEEDPTVNSDAYPGNVPKEASSEIYEVDRSANKIVCPVCGKIQKSDRELCWNCGARFTDKK